MFSDVEMSVFLEELEEKIQSINDNVLLLEKDGGSPEVIQEIFRAAHTIKGSSGVMGYEKMARLTHEIENLFDKLRQGTMEVSTHLVDVLFEALDTLKMLKDEITGEGREVHVEDITDKIRACQTGGGEIVEEFSAAAPGHISGHMNDQMRPDKFDEIIMNLIREAEVRGYQAYWINVQVDPACQMRNVRAFLVFETLQQTGEIIKSDPPAEELQEGRYDNYFSVILISKEDMDYIKNLLMSIAEISSIEIENIDSGEENGLAAVSQEVEQQKEEVKKDDNVKRQAGLEKSTIKTVRVDVQKLDNLMNLVSELVIDRTRLNRFVDIFENKFGSEELADDIVEISNHLGQITTDLQDEIMKARMLPVANVFNRLPRMVRDIAQKLGKEIDFIVEGKETELDRNVIEIIGDPLIHLIRNAIDHGIEPPDERENLGKPRKGRVFLKAAYSESHIVITLSDDGRGLALERIKEIAQKKGLMKPDALTRMSEREAFDLIFLPGFSTAAEVSDVSGRGVGMDIVRNQIEQINGTLEFHSEPGNGTMFNIKLPLTLVIVRALMVGMSSQVYAFPLANVMETLSIKDSDIRLVRHSEVIVVRGQVLPLVRLTDMFQLGMERSGEKLYVVVLGSGDRRIGVVVEKLIGEQEIVIKSLGGYLGQMTVLSGATILGDGRVALIIDAKGIIKDTGKEDISYAN
ncbi:MAG: chemotaxis protein CheA [Actinobacteria bacterium]|nr:chemotaxis protein CheA [Actinomycetota bacterium]